MCCKENRRTDGTEVVLFIFRREGEDRGLGSQDTEKLEHTAHIQVRTGVGEPWPFHLTDEEGLWPTRAGPKKDDCQEKVPLPPN